MLLQSYQEIPNEYQSDRPRFVDFQIILFISSTNCEVLQADIPCIYDRRLCLSINLQIFPRKRKKYHSTINSINYRKATCEPIYFVFSLDSIIRRKNKGLHNDSERTHAKVVRFKYFGIEKGLLMIYKNNIFFSSLLPLAGLIVHLNNHFDFTGSVLEMNIDDSSSIKLYIKSLIDRVSYRQPEWESSL